jgi:hypothetical protein
MTKLLSNTQNKVTLRWLFDNLPWDLWAWFLGIVLTAVGAGIALGQVGVVRELIGRPPGVASSPTQEDPRIEQLIKGHNERLQELQKGLIQEEYAAGGGCARWVRSSEVGGKSQKRHRP